MEKELAACIQIFGPIPLHGRPQIRATVSQSKKGTTRPLPRRLKQVGLTLPVVAWSFSPRSAGPRPATGLSGRMRVARMPAAAAARSILRLLHLARSRH